MNFFFLINGLHGSGEKKRKENSARHMSGRLDYVRKVESGGTEMCPKKLSRIRENKALQLS